MSSRSHSDRVIHVHFCETVDRLISDYLRQFRIEGLENPWKAFTASWRRQILPRIFGLPAIYLSDYFRFLLVI